MEPARKRPDSSTPETRPDLRIVGDIKAEGAFDIQTKPDLRSIPGGGQTTPDRPGRDSMRALSNPPTALPRRDGRPGISQGGAEEELSNLEKDAAQKKTDENSLEDQENDPNAGGWKNALKDKVKEEAKSRVKILNWKTGAAGGGIIGVLIGIFFLITTLAPAALLANLSGTATMNRDTQSTILDRRVMRVLDFKLNGNAVTNNQCGAVSIKALCRFSRPSNALLTTLDEFGIKAVNASGDPIEKTRVGFPNERPVSYQFTKGNGEVVDVNARDFVSTLRNDAEFRKSFTRAYNVRYLAFADTKIRTNFYKKYGVDRTGDASNGIADADNPRQAVKDIATGADEDNKVKNAADPESKNRAAQEVLTESAKKEANRTIGKLKKAGGDPFITVGTVGCIAMNVPGFIANIQRLYQMRQLIVLASTIVLTPESMSKAGDLTPETMAAIGGLLTAVAVSSTGTKSKSAMDSLGIRNVLFGDSNKSSSSFFSNLIPGGKATKDVAPIAGFANSPEVKTMCELINSPAAVAASFTIKAAIAAATAGIGAAVFTLIQGAGWIAGELIASEALAPIIDIGVTEGVKFILANTPPEVITALLGNADIENVENEALGDAIGIGINHFFAQSTLTTGGAPLSNTQVASFNDTHTESIIAYAEQDREGRSFLDASSPYTFLGSIVSNYTRNSVVAGNALKSITSSIAYTLQQPFSLLSKETYAATDDMADRCAYASDFGINQEVAVDVSGALCTGIPTEYLGVSTDALLTDVADQIDENTGIPKEDSDIAMTFADCSDGSLFNANGCLIKDQERANQSIYQYDFRINNIFDNTENVEEQAAGGNEDASGGATNTGRPPEAVDKNKGWTLAANTAVDVSGYQCDPRTEDRGTFTSPRFDYTMRLCAVSFNTNVNQNNNGSKTVNALISTNLMNMMEAARADGVELGIADAMRLDGGSTRYYSEHATGLAIDFKTASSGTICFNGNSASGYGTRDAALAACARKGGVENQAYTWMNQNAARFGFYNFDPEPWHWSTSGS